MTHRVNGNVLTGRASQVPTRLLKFIFPICLFLGVSVTAAIAEETHTFSRRSSNLQQQLKGSHSLAIVPVDFRLSDEAMPAENGIPLDAMETAISVEIDRIVRLMSARSRQNFELRDPVKNLDPEIRRSYRNSRDASARAIREISEKEKLSASSEFGVELNEALVSPRLMLAIWGRPGRAQPVLHYSPGISSDSQANWVVPAVIVSCAAAALAVTLAASFADEIGLACLEEMCKDSNGQESCFNLAPRSRSSNLNSAVASDLDTGRSLLAVNTANAHGEAEPGTISTDDASYIQLYAMLVNLESKRVLWHGFRSQAHIDPRIPQDLSTVLRKLLSPVFGRIGEVLNREERRRPIEPSIDAIDDTESSE